MTLFQAVAILMPVFVAIIMIPVALWSQYQDRAPETDAVQPDRAQQEH